MKELKGNMREMVKYILPIEEHNKDTLVTIAIDYFNKPPKKKTSCKLCRGHGFYYEDSGDTFKKYECSCF